VNHKLTLLIAIVDQFSRNKNGKTEEEVTQKQKNTISFKSKCENMYTNDGMNLKLQTNVN